MGDGERSGAVPALVELRRYRLRPGCHDELARLFSRAFVDPQREAGIQVLGWFADADEPDHFVWLRGYPQADPHVRAAALEQFYYGPAWAAHRDAANATMLDSDDVLLLRPARPECAPRECALRRQDGAPHDELRVTTCLLTERAAASVPRAVEALCGDGDGAIAVLVTAGDPNLFPALPVRDDAALVWIEPVEAPAAARRDAVMNALGDDLAGEPHEAILRPVWGSPSPLP